MIKVLIHLVLLPLLYLLGVASGYLIQNNKHTTSVPTGTFSPSRDTGMWLKQPKEIGVVIEGKNILTIYRDGLPECTEVK